MTRKSILCLLFTCAGCGSGDYTIDPQSGIENELGSSPGGGGSPSASAQQYFTDNLWPIMKLTGTSGTGCANSGCHGNASAPNQTFFKVDASSATNSWNWASVRRKNVTTSSGYAGASSVTLKSKMDSNHNTFRSWSATQKALIDAWVALP